MSARMFGPTNPAWRNARITGVCKTCQKEFLYYQSNRNRKCCSKECSYSNKERNASISSKNKGFKMPDEARNKMSLAGNGRKKTIEHALKIRASLKNHWDKRGRKSGLYVIAKGCKEFFVWHHAIRKNANYACEKCGKTKCKLDVHHKIPFSVLIAECEMDLADITGIYPIENGICLCHECHKKQHPNGCRFHQLPEGRLIILLRKLHRQTSPAEPFSGFYVRQMGEIIKAVEDQVKEKFPERTT